MWVVLYKKNPDQYITEQHMCSHVIAYRRRCALALAMNALVARVTWRQQAARLSDGDYTPSRARGGCAGGRDGAEFAAALALHLSGMHAAMVRPSMCRA